MRPTLSSRPARAEIHARLDRLSPDSVPRWISTRCMHSWIASATGIRPHRGAFIPGFGIVSGQEWRMLCWRHLDYHLRQFGV